MAANLVGNPMPTQALQVKPGERMPWIGCAVLLAAAMNAAVGLPAWAQHRVVEPDGRITYTDRPLSYEQARPGGERSAGEGVGNPPGSDWTAGLPYDQRQAAQRWPVRLYTSPACPACDQGRDWLRRQGVPVREGQVLREEDVTELLRETGGRELPVLMVGGQRLLGFASSEWGELLRLAGYSLGQPLPATWQAPAPQPLVPVKPVPPATARPAPVAPAAPADLGDPKRFRF